MLFVGCTRFSLFIPGSSAWKASGGPLGVAGYREHLYDPQRLALRAQIFLEDSLPMLEAALGEHDVHHVVSFSDTLPDEYRDLLHEAARRYPFLVLDEHVEGVPTNPPVAVAARLAARTDPPGAVVGVYRLDDDDLLPLDWFDRMAQYLVPGHVGYALSLGSGYTGLRLGRDLYALRAAYHPMLAIGLVHVFGLAAGGQLTGLAVGTGHHEVDRFAPLILDSREPGWFWTRHERQDSALVAGTPPGARLRNTVRSWLDRYPQVTDLAEVERRFPVLQGRLHLGDGPTEGWRDVLTEPVPLVDPLPIVLPAAASRVGVSVTMAGTPGLGPKRAAVTFQVGEVTDRASVQAAGLYLSNDPQIGWYRYVTTGESQSSTECVVEFPEGVTCSGVTLRRLGPPAPGAMVLRVRVLSD